jgi:recombination protein RecA
MGQIEKQFGKGSIMRLGENSHLIVETMSSGSLSLDIALGGGIPIGRIIEVYGPESSGKTTVALSAIAAAQKEGRQCAFIDADMRLILVMRKCLGWILIICLFHNPIRVSRLWKLPTRWCALAPWA